MPEPFAGSQLKVERAKKHINELQANIREFAKGDSHTVSVEYDASTNCNSFHLGIAEAAPTNFALIIGDAIHNLHSALDFAWFETVCTFTRDNLSFAKFPVRDTRDEVAIAIKGRKIPPSSKAIEDFIMDVVQPYKGGNDALWAIHNMDITDKHWYLLPSLHMTAIRGVRVEDEGGKETVFQLWVVNPGFLSIYKYFGLGNVKITNNGEATLLINFSQGLMVEGQPVIPVLLQFVDDVSRVLEGLRTILSGQ